MLTLRLAGAADAGPVGEVFAASRRLLAFLPELHSVEEDRAYVRDHMLPQQAVTVAERDNRVLGFVALTPGWIEHLYVAPDALGTGVGSALLTDAVTRSHRLDLWCFLENHRARAFYEKHGFSPVEFTDGSTNEAGAPDVRYRWSRPAAS